MPNDLEDKSGPQKNVEVKIPSPSEGSGPRSTNVDAALAEKMKKGSAEEKRELQRQAVMGVGIDDNYSRGANIRAQGVTHEEPIILPRYSDKESPYEAGELIVNDLGDTVPAIKLRAPQLPKADQPKPGEPAPLPSKR